MENSKNISQFLAARIGGLANLRKPQMGQGLMMQFIQAGEQSLQRQDLATATKYFTYGVDVSYISQGKSLGLLKFFFTSGTNHFFSKV